VTIKSRQYSRRHRRHRRRRRVLGIFPGIAENTPEYVFNIVIWKRTFVEVTSVLNSLVDVGVVDGRSSRVDERFGEMRFENGQLVDGGQKRFGVNVDVIAPAT